MCSALDQQLIARLLRHLDDGTTTLHPEPVRYVTRDYLDATVYTYELERLFAKRPVPLTHRSEVRDANSFATFSVQGLPLFLVRLHSGALMCHVNACRHRCAKLVHPNGGTLRGDIVCRFHGWTYRPDGVVSHVPEARSFPQLRPADRRLLAVPLVEQCGLLWVVPDPAVEPARVAPHLARRFSAVGTELTRYGLDDYEFFRHEPPIPASFNWKLAVEAFLEIYHFRTVHPGLQKYVFKPEVSLVDSFDLDIRITLPKQSLLSLRSDSAAIQELRPHATILYFIFPSTFVFVESTHISIMDIRPETLSTCSFHIFHCIPSYEHAEEADRNIAKFLQVVAEDIGIGESAYAGIRGGAARDVVIGRNEVGVHLFKGSLKRVLGDIDSPEGISTTVRSVPPPPESDSRED